MIDSLSNTMKTLTLNDTTYEIVDEKARLEIAVLKAKNASASNATKRASAPPIMRTESGAPVAVDDSADRPLNNLRIFGNTTQVTTTGTQLLDFSAMKMDSGGTTTAAIINGGRTVTITGTKAYAMGYIDVDVTELTGQTLYLSGSKTGGNTPSLTARLIKTDGTKSYVTALASGYTVLENDATISLQFIANNTATTLTTATTATFTEVMISAVKDAAWEPYSGGVISPSPAWAQNLDSVENPTVTIQGGNLLPVNYADGMSKTMNGITFEVQPDGAVLVNGTATDLAHFSFNYTSNKIPLPSGWISTSSGIGFGAGIPQVQNDIYVDGQYVTSVQTVMESASHGQFFGKVELGASRVKVNAGTTVVSQLVYPMLCAFENAIEYEQPKEAQTLPLTRTLHGIPVISNGNYTDSNGQQWICDEIDFERGVFIQRVGSVTLDNSLTYYYNTDSFFLHTITGVVENVAAWENRILSTHFAAVGNGLGISDYGWLQFDSTGGIRFKIEGVDTVAELMEWLSTNTPTVLYPLVIPVETYLTKEETAVFEPLYSHSTHTTVTNDCDAWMEMKYAGDFERYADTVISRVVYEVVDDAISAAEIQTAVDNWLNAHYSNAEGVSF